MGEFLEMKRQRGWGNTQALPDLANRQAVRSGFDQEPEYRKSGFLS